MDGYALSARRLDRFLLEVIKKLKYYFRRHHVAIMFLKAKSCRYRKGKDSGLELG